MTFRNIWKKLREGGKDAYRQFCFCTGFAVMLITSYLMMLMSPLIQKTLPEGGDSRKQVYMVFVLAATGCIIFAVYGAKLFLRHKSREAGVFLALGTERKRVRQALVRDVSLCTGAAATGGIVAGCVVAFVIGMIFQNLTKAVTDSSFAFTLSGFGTSIAYSLIVIAIIAGQTYFFMKKVSIMDILNTQRKQEPLKKTAGRGYLASGLILLFGGFILGFVMPVAVANMTRHYMGSWTNLFYLAALLGLYRIMVYSISGRRKGGRSQGYYKNMISTAMLRFQGASIVRNMLVVTLLLIGGFFAGFYVPINQQAMVSNIAQQEAMYSMFYTEDAQVPSKVQIQELAEKYNVQIVRYRQAEVLQVVGSGVNRDDVDENGNLVELYEKQHALYEVFSADSYKHLTGEEIRPKKGTYHLILAPGAKENLFARFDDIDLLYLDKKSQYMSMTYGGTADYSSLVQGRGTDDESRLIVSNEDFRRIEQNTGAFAREIQVLFDSQGGDALAFSKELYLRFGQGISQDMKVCNAYDAWQHQQQGASYGYRDMVQYDPENPIKPADWQYEPHFLPLQEANGLASYAVYMLLFVYVSVICLVAAEVISYARSQTVALSSSQVFSDLEKLGASPVYLRKLLSKQVRKVFALPAFIGSFGTLAFGCLMLKINDGTVTAGEIKTMFLMSLIILVAAVCQYGVYRFSRSKAEKLLGLR